MAYTEETARNLVTESARKLLRTGLVARTWGNLSARISATQFVITPSGMGYEHMRPEDLVTVNIEDCSYDGPRKPSSEKGIHAAVYSMRPEVNFVIHTHQEAASVYGITGRDLTHIDSERLGTEVPCAQYGMPSTKKLKNAVVDVLQGYPQTKAVLMRYHGALCMGTDEEDAFLAARELERVCREQIGLLGNKNREQLPPARDYGRSIRKNRRFCLQLNGEKKVYRLNRLPDDLPEEAAFHAEIYRHTDAKYILWDSSNAVRRVSRSGEDFSPYLEDLIQIAGTTIRCADGHDPAGAAKKLAGRNAVLIRGEGAFCTGRTRDDVGAVAALLEKGCRAALFAENFPECRPLGRLDGLIQRTVYVNKYSRKKER